MCKMPLFLWQNVIVKVYNFNCIYAPQTQNIDQAAKKYSRGKVPAKVGIVVCFRAL